MAYEFLLAAVFGGAMVWGAVRFAQTRRRSHLVLIVLGLVPLISLLWPSPLILPAVIALSALRWYVQWLERQLPPNDRELAEREQLTREVTDEQRNAGEP
jgi:hypothetical protein